MVKFVCRKKNCSFSTDHKFLLKNHQIKKLCRLFPKKQQNQLIEIKQLQLQKVQKIDKQYHEIVQFGKKEDEIKQQSTQILNFNQIYFINLLGKGTYGHVFLGIFNNKQYAVKLIASQNKSSFRKQIYFYKKFQKFPQFVKLNHYRYCRNDFYVIVSQKMDFPLSWLEKISQYQSLMLLKQMIKKISILHTHGYLHNDLKTSNIMLFKGQPFIIDFGMADKYSKSLQPDQDVTHVYYRSIKSHAGIPNSPASQIEALIYIAIQLCNDQLPWSPLVQQYYNHGKNKIYLNRIRKQKQKCVDQCQHQLLQLFIYLQSLNQGQLPEYQYIDELIDKLIDRSQKISILGTHYQQYKKNFNQKKIFFKIFDKLSIYDFKFKKTQQQWIFKYPNFKIQLNWNGKKFHNNKIFQFISPHINQWPSHVIDKYFNENKLTNFEIFDILNKYQLKQQQHYFYVEYNGHNHQSMIKKLKQPSSQLKIFLIYDSSIKNAHFFVCIPNLNNLISFDSLKRTIKIPHHNVIKSKQCILQKNNWACGYISLIWIKLISKIGIQNWLSYVQ